MSDVPPQALEAEESVLGAMMMSVNAIGAVSDILEPEDFYRDTHGRIYRTALEMYGKGEPVDAITLIDGLDRRNLLEDIGGRVRIHELARLVPSSANVKHYAGIVKDAAQRRGLIQAGMGISQLGWDGGEELIERAEEMVMALAPHTGHETVYTAKDCVERFRLKIESSKIIETQGIPSPWPFLGRLKGSRLYVLAGYTSHGKSAAAVQFIQPACEAGEKVVFVTNEMSEPDLTARLISTFGVPHHQCESGQIEGHYRSTVDSALSQIEEWDYRVVDDESVDLKALRRHVRIQRPGLLIIDHLHRFDWEDRRDLERTIKGITNLAREFDIPVLLLAQLSRTGDWKNPFPRPSLPQLRETAILEQEAWCVWFVWRKTDEFHQPGTEAELLISKNRGGQLDWKRMEFEPQYVRFAEAALSMAPVAA